MGTPTPVYLQYVTFGDDLRNDEVRDKKQIEMADKKPTITATTIASGKGGGETPVYLQYVIICKHSHTRFVCRAKLKSSRQLKK